jgi:EmrB/QacA subfamily drug resistance transporter
MLSLLIISLDNTILNVALPTLVEDLDASASDLQWIVDSYVLVFAGMLLTAGLLGDRYGRKAALFTGFVIFGVTSLWAAFSSSSGELIAARAVMGLGGAFIMPSTLSILMNVFPPHERPRAIALWAGVAGLGVPLGPVIGGYLLKHFDWGSIFLVNIPIILVTMIAGWFLLPESKDREASPLDPLGAVFSIAGLATLLYGIIEAPAHGWTSVSTLLTIGAGVVLLGLFIWWELRIPQPMLNINFFKNPRFSAGSLSITLVFFALFGSVFFLPQYFQFALSYSALESGVRMLPLAAGILGGSLVSARLAERLGAKIVVTAGLTIAALGMVVFSTITDGTGYDRIFLGILVMSFGMGIAVAPATDAVMGAVPRENAGVGSAVNDTTRQVGGALGVAILGSLFSTRYSADMQGTVDGLPAPAADAARDSLGAALQVAQQIGGEPGLALAAAARSTFIDAMGLTFLVAAGVAFAGALLALVLLPAYETPAGAQPGTTAEATSDELLEPESQPIGVS